MSPELLFLVMDVREAIEDAGEDVEALMKLKEENEERVEEADDEGWRGIGRRDDVR